MQEKSAIDKKKSMKPLIKVLVLSILLLAVLLATRPDQLPLVALPIPFILFFAVWYVFFRWLLHKVLSLRTSKEVILSVFFAALPSAVLVLSSLHQLSGFDIAVVAALLLGALFYLRYADFL